MVPDEVPEQEQDHGQRTHTIEEAARILRISRSSAFRAARRGELPTIRVGHLLRVPAGRLKEMLGEVPK
jgi:excisionase family DNA binding protein